VLSHATSDLIPDKQLAEAAKGRFGPFWPRSREQITRFFDGLELLPPGITSVAHWRADNEPQPRPTAAETSAYCVVARIPERCSDRRSASQTATGRFEIRGISWNPPYRRPESPD
jgi:S-adenosyl methyltransferase